MRRLVRRSSPEKGYHGIRRLSRRSEPGGPVDTIKRMSVYDEKRDELERYEIMMGVPRGRLAVTLGAITDAMALVGQHGVYCQSQRQLGKPALDIQVVMKSLTDAKELIQGVMEALKEQRKIAP
jgi:hypothetical protein